MPLIVPEGYTAPVLEQNQMHDSKWNLRREKNEPKNQYMVM